MFRLVSALVLALGVSSQALAVEDGYFQIKSVNVTEVTEQYPQELPQTNVMSTSFNQDCNNPFGSRPVLASNPLDALTTAEIYFDQIVNFGKKIWAIIELGRPVSNVNIDVASALPKGLACWTDLSGWNAPQSKVYRVSYENLFGMTVVDYTYRVTATTGGSKDGVGQYITNATFQPAEVYVAWGFKFNAEAQIPSVYNMGTKEAPIAGMQMNMKWSVDTVMAHAEQTDTYHVSGKNELVKLK